MRSSSWAGVSTPRISGLKELQAMASCKDQVPFDYRESRMRGTCQTATGSSVPVLPVVPYPTIESPSLPAPDWRTGTPLFAYLPRIRIQAAPALFGHFSRTPKHRSPSATNGKICEEQQSNRRPVPPAAEAENWSFSAVNRSNKFRNFRLKRDSLLAPPGSFPPEDGPFAKTTGRRSR